MTHAIYIAKKPVNLLAKKPVIIHARKHVKILVTILVKEHAGVDVKARAKKRVKVSVKVIAKDHASLHVMTHVLVLAMVVLVLVLDTALVAPAAVRVIALDTALVAPAAVRVIVLVDAPIRHALVDVTVHAGVALVLAKQNVLVVREHALSHVQKHVELPVVICALNHAALPAVIHALEVVVEDVNLDVKVARRHAKVHANPVVAANAQDARHVLDALELVQGHAKVDATVHALADAEISVSVAAQVHAHHAQDSAWVAHHVQDVQCNAPDANSNALPVVCFHALPVVQLHVKALAMAA